MIDVHCHILPEIDDGAKNIEESIMMAKIASEEGIKTIIATPHYIEGEYFREKFFNKEVLKQLNSEIKLRNIDLEVLLGNEVFISPNIFNLLDNDKIAKLNNSKYMLIELPYWEIPFYTEKILYNLKLRGITPILAHPERNHKIIDNPNVLYNFIKQGVLAQMNINSIMDNESKVIRKTSEILLAHNMIHFIATDAHSYKFRTPRVKDKLVALYKIIGSENTYKLTYDNPKFVIEDRDILIDKPIKYKGKNIVKRLFKLN